MPTVEVVEVETHVYGLAGAKAQLRWSEHALDDMRDPIEGIVEDIHRQTLQQFLTEGGALGSPWDELDPSTIAEKATHGYAFPDWPLVASGAMMDSATSNAGPYSVTDVAEHEAVLTLDWFRGGWNIPLLHQLGVPWRMVTQHRHRKDGSAYTVSYMWHLPSRPFWEATDRLGEEGLDRLADWILGP